MKNVPLILFVCFLVSLSLSLSAVVFFASLTFGIVYQMPKISSYTPCFKQWIAYWKGVQAEKRYSENAWCTPDKKENWSWREKKTEIIWFECITMHEFSFKCENVLINSCINTSICTKCVGSFRTCKDSKFPQLKKLHCLTVLPHRQYNLVKSKLSAISFDNWAQNANKAKETA